jgi:hypothetical protein
MKRILGILTTACVVAAVATSSAVAKGPTHTNSNGKGPQTLTATCTVLGSVTVHATSGASAWVNNTHYLLLRLTGTFTPTGGTPQPFTKAYGHKTGFGQTYTCTGTHTQAMGTLTFTATVARTPTH